MKDSLTRLFPGRPSVPPTPSILSILILPVPNKAGGRNPGIFKLITTPDFSFTAKIESRQAGNTIQCCTKTVNYYTIPHCSLDGDGGFFGAMILTLHRFAPRFFRFGRNRRVSVPELISFILWIGVIRGQAIKSSDVVRTGALSVPQANLERARPVHKARILCDELLVVLPVRLFRDLRLEGLAIFFERLSVTLN